MIHSKTVPMITPSPGAITAFARMHNALLAGDYRGANRFRRELRSFGYSVLPIESASAHRATRPIQQVNDPVPPDRGTGSRFRSGLGKGSRPSFGRTYPLD